MLTIQHLSVSYGETLILRDVSLDVGPGEVVCLLGRNGVGKTTLLKSIMGLLRPRSGQVCFDGQDITRASPDVRARAGIGYVPQGREIFPHLTVLENLQVGMAAKKGTGLFCRNGPEGASHKRAPSPFSTLRTVPEFVFEYFPALKSILNRKGGVLSGGQQQQLAIARVLVAEPRLLILDEPTEGIQPTVISLIGQVLKNLKGDGKVSVLLVEQYIEFASRLADKYYVMEKGAIVMHGSSKEINKEAIKPYLAF